MIDLYWMDNGTGPYLEVYTPRERGIDAFKAHVQEAREFIALNNLDGVWLTPLRRGDAKAVRINACDEDQFSIVRDYLVPKPPQRQFAAVHMMAAKLHRPTASP